MPCALKYTIPDSTKAKLVLKKSPLLLTFSGERSRRAQPGVAALTVEDRKLLRTTQYSNHRAVPRISTSVNKCGSPALLRTELKKTPDSFRAIGDGILKRAAHVVAVAPLHCNKFVKNRS